MSEELLDVEGGRIHATAQDARRMAVVVAKRRRYEALRAGLAHIRLDAKGREMGAHKPQEVDHDARDGKAERRPSVTDDAGRLPPPGGDRNEVMDNKPDEHVGHHGEHHRDCHERTADGGERPPCSSEVHDARYRRTPLLPCHKRFPSTRPKITTTRRANDT